MVGHPITGRIVQDRPTFKESDEYNQLQELISDIIVAHDALGDIMLRTAVFGRIYARFVSNGLQNPVNEGIKISNNPIPIPRMPFGKDGGMLFSEVPVDYLQWLSATELDEKWRIRLNITLDKDRRSCHGES